MTQPPPSRHSRSSPARILAIGVGVTLATIAAVGAYTFTEIRALRDEQTAISERNRKGSLQLLRIQNDLSLLAGMMRDMADNVEPYPLHSFQPAMDRVRRDLEEATAIERSLTPAREPEQQRHLTESMAQYWRDVDAMFALSRTDEPAARQMIRATLVPGHRALDTLISRLLVVNNRMQEEAAIANRGIYDQVGREILLLVAALLVVTAGVGAWVVAANRRAFAEVAAMTGQLRTLSWRTLRLQEDVQRAIARELHDDFGQIVTAIGTLIGRARRHVAADSPVAAELEQVRGVAQQALDRIRTQSQWLHPGVLDDFGLAKALEHLAAQFARQTGIRTRFSTSGPVDSIDDERAIHVYRITQEALSNINRHSGASEAWIRLACTGAAVVLEVEDRGKGMPAAGESPEAERGMGLVSMRERAELIGGELQLLRPADGGVTVHLALPARPAAAFPSEA